MWNARRQSNDGKDEGSEGDPRMAAVSALASFANHPPPFPGPYLPPPSMGSHPMGPYPGEMPRYAMYPYHPMTGHPYAMPPVRPDHHREAERMRQSGYAAYAPHSQPPPPVAALPAPPQAEDDSSSEDPPRTAGPIKPRGKPESMAVKLAAAKIETKRRELEEEERLEQGGEEAVAEPVADVLEEGDDAQDDGGVLVTVATPPPSKTGIKKKATPTRSKQKKKVTKDVPVGSPERTELLLNEKAPRISEAEYDNLESLMVLFCRVPLLAEFSRPVSLLHPELISVYTRIVSHPVDLGHICRGIRRRQYRSLRDVRLDMWRVFANCVKFHSHPNNKEAVPTFVSIALHLREYFNHLWQEFMLPSDLPDGASEVIAASISRRAAERAKRIDNSGVLILQAPFVKKTASLLATFLDNGGRVDGLDDEPIFAKEQIASDSELGVVFNSFSRCQKQLEEMAADRADYTLDALYTDLTECYTGDVLEGNPALRNRIANRVDRFFWKRAIPLHEANSRGVTQSSVWGNVAASIWARESGNKVYWPALCLGILSPKEQREGWHFAVTERNESRLPEKLRAQLLAAKVKCEQTQKKQNLSFFLVEFLGIHSFLWVSEKDIIDAFSPDDDPNKAPGPATKKKRSSRSATSSIVGSKTYAKALEECEWAQDEYTNVVQEVFHVDADGDEGEDGEEMNYSYAVLAQSDDEADDEDDHGFQYDEDSMSASDADEANWLLANDGLMDTNASARKKAKKKSVTKKKVGEKDRKDPPGSTKKDDKLQQKAREKEEKHELLVLEKRRKKRTRDREKALRDESRKQKRKRTASGDSSDDDKGLTRDKRARASAIVKAYLVRTARQNDEYKSLALNGVMTMPASMVDPTGLLGMALAFRAAAGVLNMPGDENDDQVSKSTKPWMAIDTTSAKTSSERQENLEKQIKLIENEIKRVRMNTSRRQELTKIAVEQREAMDREVEADDMAARLNHFKKKKKMSPKQNKKAEGDESVMDVDDADTPHARSGGGNASDKDDEAAGAEFEADGDVQEDEALVESVVGHSS